MPEDLEELYQEVILDHYKHPRCHGALPNPSQRLCVYNPLCGDHIELTVEISENKIKDLAFTGHGCSISQAAASIMSDLCKGKDVSQVLGFCNKFKGMMRGEESGETVEILGDAVALEGVRKFSARVKCATLAWEALEKCVLEHQKT